jgi:hypothetical protein
MTAPGGRGRFRAAWLTAIGGPKRSGGPPPRARQGARRSGREYIHAGFGNRGARSGPGRTTAPFQIRLRPRRPRSAADDETYRTPWQRRGRQGPLGGASGRHAGRGAPASPLRGPARVQIDRFGSTGPRRASSSYQRNSIREDPRREIAPNDQNDRRKRSRPRRPSDARRPDPSHRTPDDQTSASARSGSAPASRREARCTETTCHEREETRQVGTADSAVRNPDPV